MRSVCLLLASASTLFFSGCEKEKTSVSEKKVVYLPAIQEDFYPEIEREVKKEIKTEITKEESIEKKEKIIAQIIVEETQEEITEKTTEEIVAELETIWRGEKMTPEEIEEERLAKGGALTLSSASTGKSTAAVPQKEIEKINEREQERKLIEIVQVVRQKNTLEEQKFFLQKELKTLENKRENMGILVELKNFLSKPLHTEVDAKILEIVQSGS